MTMRNLGASGSLTRFGQKIRNSVVIFHIGKNTLQRWQDCEILDANEGSVSLTANTRNMVM